MSPRNRWLLIACIVAVAAPAGIYYGLFGDECRHMQTWSRPANCPYPSHSGCDVLTDLGYRNIKDADDASNMGQG